MINKEQFINQIVPYLRRIEAIPEQFIHADETQFLADLYTVCSDKNRTTWQQQSFMLGKYASENMDFLSLVAATCAAISNTDGLPDKVILAQLIDVADAFLAKIAPSMPSNIRHLTSEFVVNKSAFHMDSSTIRAPLDACAANWEEYPLPFFDWPWPEFERELAVHEGMLPENILRYQTPFGGDKDINEWRKELLEKPDSDWLEDCAIKNLRQVQKQYRLKPARTKKELANIIAELNPLPNNIQALIDDKRRDFLDLIDKEEARLKLPLAELYKRHLVCLVQNRVDSFFSASYVYLSPQKQRENNAKMELEKAKIEYEEAKNMNLLLEENKLYAAFCTELGDNWETRKAATRLFKKMMDDKRWRTSASLSDFIAKRKELISLWKTPEERTSLVIREICPLCRGREKIINFQTPDDLPPFHLLCTCQPPLWEVEFDFLRPSSLDSSKSGPILEQAISDFVKRNIIASGLAFRIPTISDMVEFMDAAMQDEENAKRQVVISAPQETNNKPSRPGIFARFRHLFTPK